MLRYYLHGGAGDEVRNQDWLRFRQFSFKEKR